MKKMLFIVAISAIATTSCTKDRTCSCTDDIPGSTADVTILVGVTKAQGKSNCVSTKYSDSKGNSVTTTCTLK